MNEKGLAQVSAQVDDARHKAASTGDILIHILSRHCGERGDNEGAVETLERIIREREILIRNGIKNQLLKLA